MRLIDADALMELYADSKDFSIAMCNVPIPIVRQNILDMPTIEVKQDPPFSEQELENLICGCSAQIQEFCTSKAEVEPFENLIHKLEWMIGDLYGTRKEL